MTHSVSIIIATYNRANLLDNAIKSVLNQTYRNWELIIIDDGSTDTTYQLIEKYFFKVGSLKYLKQSNKGLPSARNVGIKLANGYYITFLDSDDEYKKEHLKLRVDFMNSNQDVDLIYGGIEIIGDPFVPDKYDRKKLIHINDCIVGATFFGKRQVFTKLNGFKNVDYSEDSEFFERAQKKFIIKKVDFPTYIYNRTENNSITRNA